MPKVSIVACNSYDEAEIDRSVKGSIDLIGGISAFIKPGQKVLLKVNALMALDPSSACPTHPAIVKAVAKLVTKEGAVPFIGDSPGGISTDFNRVFEICGYNKTAKELGIETVDLKKIKITNAEIKLKGKTITVPVTDLNGRFDVIINLPKLKTHILTVMTGAIKNMFGSVPGYYKSKLHFIATNADDFCSMLIGVYKKTMPVLTVMDAVESMEGNGPSGGQAKKTKTIFASSDGFALDTVSAYCMGFAAGDVPALAADINEIEILGRPLQESLFADFKKPVSAYRVLKRIPPVFYNALSSLLSRIKNVPEIDKRKCSACQTCVKNCPAECITVVKGLKYDIDYSKCVACFCCHEMCPEKAVKIKRSILARVLHL
jgi:uncharacterized protein (DUF362 family)/Pyruvate/2-oxoacid:ferredoxin oxidoreductase delta subunit